MIRKGERFFDPADSDSGYEATRDIMRGESAEVHPNDLSAFRGAPPPVMHEDMPRWLYDVIWGRLNARH